MSGTHEPREAFVAQLAEQITAASRRRNRDVVSSGWRGWLLASPLKTAVATACLMLVSMGVGGAAVAARYEARFAGQRDALIATYEQRRQMAQDRVKHATDKLFLVQRQVSVGTESQEELVDANFKVKEAQAQLQSIELQLAEVRATSQEPVSTVSAPLVSGRDFVTERWRAEMTVPAAALESSQAQLAASQKRFSVGIGSNEDVQSAREGVAELQIALSAWQKRLDIRQRFLKHEVDAAMADLLSLENDADQRSQTLWPRIELAQQNVANLAKKVDVGSAQQVDLAGARLHLQELQFDEEKARYDLVVVRQQIQQYRGRCNPAVDRCR